MITCGGCVHPQHQHDPDSGDCAILHCGCHWTPPTRSYPILLQTDLDALGVDSVACAQCAAVLRADQPYQDRLLAMTDAGEIITEATCVYC